MISVIFISSRLFAGGSGREEEGRGGKKTGAHAYARVFASTLLVEEWERTKWRKRRRYLRRSLLGRGDLLNEARRASMNSSVDFVSGDREKTC